ncbi:MAG TPA: hypothetical protein PKE20_01550 [Promineifilum sp.]|nr:hypothetical protein [Promineifilum sp.]
MNHNDPIDEDALQARMQYLLDLDISTGLPPDQRLLLAILRQSVIDYFGDDPLERLSAALYFARSPVYKSTLQLFNLPDDLLPVGVDLSAFKRKENLNQDFETDPLRLETLVRQLSGTQLKIVLTMGLLPLPAATRKISLNCGLTRSTVLVALEQLATQGLVERHDDGSRPVWSLPAPVRRVLDEVWGAGGR